MISGTRRRLARLETVLTVADPGVTPDQLRRMAALVVTSPFDARLREHAAQIVAERPQEFEIVLCAAPMWEASGEDEPPQVLRLRSGG